MFLLGLMKMNEIKKIKIEYGSHVIPYFVQCGYDDKDSEEFKEALLAAHVMTVSKSSFWSVVFECFAAHIDYMLDDYPRWFMENYKGSKRHAENDCSFAAMINKKNISVALASGSLFSEPGEGDQFLWSLC